MKKTTKLIMKNVQLRVQNNLLKKETRKAIKEMDKALSDLDCMQNNNIFLIEENDVLKGKLRKYQQKEDHINGKKLKKKLDKEIENGNKK